MIYDWQKDLLKQVKPGQTLNVMTAGRNVGKSQLANYAKLWNEIYYKEMPTYTLTEGKVFDEPYYVVKLFGYNWAEVEEWCTESFGPTPKEGVWEPHGRWYANNAALWFREAKDRDWFVMRWGS